jgi:hypothetical protein
MREGQQLSRNLVLDLPQSDAGPQNQVARQRRVAAHQLRAVRTPPCIATPRSSGLTNNIIHKIILLVLIADLMST